MIKSFLNISDLSRNDIDQIINLSDENKVLKEKNIGLIFEKNSTRTRLSFAVGINDLGGNFIDLKYEDLNISRNESFEDTFKALNCYLDGLVFRTSDHKKLLQASKYFSKPVINALSDISHPCQTISDIYTLHNHFKTYNLNILWMGDMNNVCYSLVELANLFEEINLSICTPKQISNSINWKFKNNINLISDYNDIDLKKINCVMTDVFVSMNDKRDDNKINILKSYKVDMILMNKLNSSSVFMHCLPAKVGMEVTKEVINGPKSIVWEQAKNRMIAQKKLMNFIEW